MMIALLMGNFVLMALDAREADSKQRLIRVWMQAIADGVQSPVTTISSAVDGYLKKVSTMRDASSENDQLKQRVQELEMQLQGKETLTNENERLKSLLDLKEEKKGTVLPAKIIARDPSIWFNSAIINRGSLAGVKLNMPVITNDGLAGRIIAVSPLTSQFMLLSDDKSGVSAIVGQIGASDALGLIKGTKERGVLEMTYVSGLVPVNMGDMVYTTGLDGIFPSGLKVGEIVDIRQGSSTTPHTIYIRPAAKIGALQEVAVLLYEAPLRQKFDQALPNALPDEQGAKTGPLKTPTPAR